VYSLYIGQGMRVPQRYFWKCSCCEQSSESILLQLPDKLPISSLCMYKVEKSGLWMSGMEWRCAREVAAGGQRLQLLPPATRAFIPPCLHHRAQRKSQLVPGIAANSLLFFFTPSWSASSPNSSPLTARPSSLARRRAAPSDFTALRSAPALRPPAQLAWARLCTPDSQS
jgi:hypothetical protein